MKQLTPDSRSWGAAIGSEVIDAEVNFKKGRFSFLLNTTYLSLALMAVCMG